MSDASEGTGKRQHLGMAEEVEARIEIASTAPRRASGPLIPFGPYAGLSISDVAVIDPTYLLDWVREGIGDAEFRAEAARVLASRRPDRSIAARVRPWLAGGLAGLLVLAFLSQGVALLSGSSSFVDKNGSRSAAFEPGSGTRSAGMAEVNAATNEAVTKGSRSGQVGASSDTITATSPNDRDDATQSEGTSIDYDAPCGARVPGAIPADSAGDFLDSFQAVEFEVMRSKDTGKVTFLNSRDPYQGHFYVAIFPGDYEQFGGAPAQRFKGRCIVVQGLIETYRGSPQIVLRDAADLRVVERVMERDMDREP